MSDGLAVAFILGIAVAVGNHIWSARRFDRELKERRERSDAEHEQFMCALWQRMGADEHRRNCQRCLGHNERPQA